ncbi:MAG: hypothetical protein ACXWM8_03090 [Candidatus Limnocylindrales bacterium]
MAAAQRPVAASSPRAALASAVGFACLGALFVLLGLASILTATPAQAHDLLPLAKIGDITRPSGEVAPLLSATIAALVVVAVAALLAARRLDALAAAIELLVLGLVIEGCVLGTIGRIGHATDGSVLGAAVVCIMGGTAVIASGIVALLARE